MESLDELKNYWQKQPQPQVTPLNKININTAVQAGLRKERNKVRDYVWLAGFWQWFVYAALCHLLVRFWGDWQYMAWCFGGILLYIPFTWVFMRKIKAFHALGVRKKGIPLPDVRTNIKDQHAVLASFYSFKKRFDLLMIPAASFIVTITCSQFNWSPPLTDSLPVHVCIFVVTLVAFTTATYHENKKHFKAPLQNLKSIISDLEKDVSR